MADRKHQQQLQSETASKIDALYSWLSYDLQRIKTELMNELKLSSVQVGALCKEMKDETQGSSRAITQELRFGYKQNQTIYDGITSMVSEEVGDRLGAMDEKLAVLEDIRAEFAALKEDDSEKLALLEKVDALIAQVNEKIAESNQSLAQSISAIPTTEVDYDRIVDGVGDKVMEALCDVKEGNAEVLQSLAIDYDRIKKSAAVDYERIINGSAEKIIESLPYPEKVDYRRITDITEKAVASAVEKVLSAINVDALANTVLEKVTSAFDVNALADVVSDKVNSAFDADALVNAVAEKLAPCLKAPEVDYEKLSDMVVAKLAANTENKYEVVLDNEGIAQMADLVSEKISAPEIDYARIETIVEEKMACEEEEEPTYDLVIDEEGIEAIASSVAEKIGTVVVCEEVCATEVPAEAVEEPVVEAAVEEPVAEEVVEENPVEEVPAESVEEPIVEAVVAEPVVEEVVDESSVEEVPVEEPVAEEVVEAVEEPVVEKPVVPATTAEALEELAIADLIDLQEVNNQLVDAEHGLVIRLKKSFTAKMRQSEEKVKGYYSDIKNELTSYKRINSNVSWHGDRFNFGRETVAKINICGKTLCFYIALDPNDPEYKTTVYHQKDVGSQKAYENTPFMVKIKSDAAAKKALRLVGYLAEKIGTEKEEGYQAVDYVEEFAYQSTKELFEGGFIKATKEKKVDLDF